jgi:hypothetical protein
MPQPGRNDAARTQPLSPGGLAAWFRGRKRDGAVRRVVPTATDRDHGAAKYEIEITAAMIAAGGETLWRRLCHDPLLSPGLADDLAEDVLRAALLCAPYKS